MNQNPFPGPQPYRASDRERFFGREDLAARLGDNVIANRCVTVYGPSGAGKTSLMQAAVLPKLVESHGISVVRIDGWPEGEAPSSWLENAMYTQLGFGKAPPDLPFEEAIFAAARRAARRSSRLLVVYLDQLEQLLYSSRSADEVDAFFECVHALVDLPLRNVRVVLSLREDYLGRFRDRLRDLARLISHGVRIGPLTVAELCDAVCQAAATGDPPQTWSREEMRGLMLQVRVAGQAESDEAEGQAVYAQVVCRALFQVRDEGKEAEAGPRGAEAEPILRRYFDMTLDSLGPLRSSAERLLEDHLITADGTRTLRTEKELLRILPAAELSPILQVLEGAAILHAEEHQGSRYFEIGHDWLARRVYEARARREREAEERRRKKEQDEALARERAEAEAKLAKEHRKRRSLRIIAGTSLLGLVVCGVLGALALYGKVQADRARKDAEDAQKAADSARSKAHDAQIMAAARELESLGQIGWAMKLLPMAEHPERRRDWVTMASDALNKSALRATLIGHTTPLSVALWSPEGERILTASTEGTARVWRADNKSDPIVLSDDAHGESAVLAATWTPDGNHVITGSADGKLRKWSADGKGSPILLGALSKKSIVSVAVSHDGERVLTVSEDNTARLWNVNGTGDPVTIGDGKSPVTRAIFQPEGGRVITISEDAIARVWPDDRSKKPVELKGHTASIVNVTASPDGKHIVTTSLDRTARIFSADGKEPPIVLSHEGIVLHAAVSPDNKLVATACSDGTARVWTIDGKPTPGILRSTQPMTLVAFGPYSTLLAAASTDEIVRVSAVNGADTPLELRGHDALIASIAWSPDGRQIVTAASDPNDASPDRTAKVWSIDPLRSMQRTRRDDHLFHAAFIGADGKKVVSAYDDNTARLWSMDESAQGAEFKGHTGWVANAALSPKGDRVVTASFDKTARVWKVDRPEEPPVVLRGHSAEVRFAAFSPDDDGARVVTVSDDRTARVFRADGEGQPVELSGHEDGLTSAAWSPDGKRIVTTSLDRTARVWDAEGKSKPIVLQGHHVNDVLSAAWSPDNKRIVTAGRDRTTQIWNADGSGTPISRTYPDTVLVAIWSPKGERFAVSTADKTVRIWNTADGTGLPIALTVPAPVIAMQFQGEQSLVTVDEANTAKTWTIDITALKERLPEVDTDCVPPQALVRALDLPSKVAIAHYTACEIAHQRHRLPLLEGLRP